jgi:hypothetical protein
MSFFNWIVENWSVVLNAIVGLLSAVIAICLLIPGDVPEKQLQAIVDFLKKFSKK